MPRGKLIINRDDDYTPPKSYSGATGNNARNKTQVQLYGEELSPLEWVFIEKYLLTFNQTQSYLQSYLQIFGRETTSQNASREANRLLKEKRIQNGIKLFRKEVINRININREQFVYWVVEYLNKVKEDGKEKLELDTLKYLGTILGFSTPNNFHVSNKFLVNVGGFNPDEQLKKINNYQELTPEILNQKLQDFQFENIEPVPDLPEENNIEIDFSEDGTTEEDSQDNVNA